jgi:hypothetical protein
VATLTKAHIVERLFAQNLFTKTESINGAVESS